jgi:glycosyltransferase involved in cell wall biosynthesis
MAGLKKVSILNYDLSNNSLGRAHILAQALSNNYEVEIIGPTRGGDIWEPLRECETRIKKIPGGGFPFLLFKLPSILKKIDGDILYAVKPRFTSFGLALLKKLFSKTPVILDIDDWEMGFYLKGRLPSRISRLLDIANPNGFLWTWLLHLLIPLADGKTTVSTFLRDRYGGTIVPHAKDTGYFDPARFNGPNPAAGAETEGKKIIMFLGTPRKPKGLDDALDAVLMLDEPDVALMVVGADPGGRYEKKLKKKGGNRLIMVGRIPANQAPEYLAAADVIVIPQRRTSATVGQIPSKVFDAMAMAKPIVSTGVSDIPEILDGCGMVVRPDSPEDLGKAIKWILDNPEEGALMGLNARKKCIDSYSLGAIRESLINIVEKAGAES